MINKYSVLGLFFILFLAVGCDSNNQSQAQDDDDLPGGSPPPAMTVVSGTVEDPGSQRDGTLSDSTRATL